MRQPSYIAYFTLSFLAASGLALAQDQPAVQPDTQQQNSNPPSTGWRRVGDPAPADASGAPSAPQAPAYPNPAPAANGGYTGQPADPRSFEGNTGMPPQQQGMPPQAMQRPIPATLTLKPGTYLTVRVNQTLSSDRNHAGDAFSATLVKPVIVDGVVVAAPGQTVGGKVVEAKKAGMVQGTSRLGVQLTDLTVVDGQNLPLQSQFISRNGPTTVRRDVGAVAGTTALGAGVGAAADWGRGAAIGAGAGAAVGILGVLLTRGVPTVIYPEQVLTFRVDNTVVIATDRAPQAFHWVRPGEYDGGSPNLTRRPPPYGMTGQGYPGAYPGAYAPAPYPAYYGPAYYYGPGYYPYYWGPSVGFYFGHGGYYHGGFRR
jgi:hypothetical protein